MSIDSRAFLHEAERLLEQNQGEATSRTIVSRAYYGAYHLANDWHGNLPQPGIQLADVGQHKNFINQLEHPTVQDTNLANQSKSLGFQLKGLLLRRVKADYKLSEDMSEKEAVNATAKSRVIHEQFGS